MRLGISSGYVSEIEQGNKIPGGEVLSSLKINFDCDPGWLLTGEGSMVRGEPPPRSPLVRGEVDRDTDKRAEFAYVPRYSLQAVGGEGEIVYEEVTEDLLAFRKDWLRNEIGVSPKNLAIIAAAGDSMEPTIRAGDALLVDRDVTRLRNEGIYVINFDGGLIVKRLENPLDGTLILKSDNKATAQDRRVSLQDIDRLRVVGRVVWVGRKM